MFKNKSLGVKLSAGFGIVLTLLVVITTLSITRMKVVYKAVNEIVEVTDKKIEVANDLVDQFRELAISARNIALSHVMTISRRKKKKKSLSSV